MLSKANLITINLTKKNHINLQIIKAIDNAHNHLFIINFYAPPNDKHKNREDRRDRSTNVKCLSNVLAFDGKE